MGEGGPVAIHLNSIYIYIIYIHDSMMDHGVKSIDCYLVILVDEFPFRTSERLLKLAMLGIEYP